MIGQPKGGEYITALRNFYAGGDFIAKGETAMATPNRARELKGSGQARAATKDEIKAYSEKGSAVADTTAASAGKAGKAGKAANSATDTAADTAAATGE